MYKRAAFKFILLILAVMIVDLVIKYWVKNRLGNGEQIELLGGWLVIAPVKSLRMAFGIRGGGSLLDLAEIFFKVLVLVFFIRVQRLPVSKWFKYATALIVVGWIGNYADRFISGSEDAGYMHLDYFSFGGSAFMNLSSVMTMAGWTLLLIAVIIRFRDLALVFRKQARQCING